MSDQGTNPVQPINPSTIIVPPAIIGKYVVYLQYIYTDRPLPKHPDNKLFKILSKATHLIHSYYIRDRWIFQIHENEVIDILLVPGISYHARIRLEQRFGIKGPLFNLRVAFEIAFGEELSSHQKKRNNIGPNLTAVQFEDRLYLITLDNFRLVTAIRQPTKP